MQRIGLAILLAALGAAPAVADVKAGVDAWQRGDYKRAVSEWQGPAERGDPDAQFNLGQAYKLGRGVPVNLIQAEEWYRRAALQNHPQAQDNYGLILYQNGKHGDAVRWLTLSAGRGELRAMFVLGTLYFNGDSVAKDYPRAYALLSLAASGRQARAREVLTQIDPYLTLADRQQGQVIARQYEADAARGGQVALALAGPQPVPAPAPAPSGGIRTADLPPSSVYQPDPPLPAPSPTPTPTPTVRVASVPPPAPKPSPQVVAPAPAPSPIPVRPAQVVDGGWRLQLGAFGEPGNAQKLWSQVGGRFPGRSVSFVKSGRLTLVLVGPFASQAEARGACGGVSPCVPTRR